MRLWVTSCFLLNRDRLSSVVCFFGEVGNAEVLNISRIGANVYIYAFYKYFLPVSQLKLQNSELNFSIYVPKFILAMMVVLKW